MLFEIDCTDKFQVQISWHIKINDIRPAYCLIDKNRKKETNKDF